MGRVQQTGGSLPADNGFIAIFLVFVIHEGFVGEGYILGHAVRPFFPCVQKLKWGLVGLLEEQFVEGACSKDLKICESLSIHIVRTTNQVSARKSS